MIKVVAKGTLKQDASKEEYLKLAKELAVETNKEPGCISYVVHEEINDPTVVTMIEAWESEEALKGHNETEHVLRIVPELRKLRESVEINIYKEVQ